MPWQIVVALVLTGLDGLALAFMAAGLASVAGSMPERFRLMPLLLMMPVALAAVVYIILGVCIAVRLNRARKLAIVVNFILLLFAVLALAISVPLGELNVPALASGAFSLFMISLLGSDQSQAYTYRGGDDSWPEE